MTDSELVCLAVAQVLLGARSEGHWIRYARVHLAGMFPYLPQRPGYNKRLRAALPLVKKVIRDLARDSDFWFDNHWIAYHHRRRQRSLSRLTPIEFETIMTPPASQAA